MKRTTGLKCGCAAFACVLFCGGWTNAAVAEQADLSDRYVGGMLISTYATTSETVAYSSKTVVENIPTSNTAPAYTSGNLPNGCGAVAGANIVGFYDRYYSELIPGWDSCYPFGMYKGADGVYVPKVMNELFTAMKTNVAAPGVSESEFRTGLKSYVNGKGYDITYNSLGKGTSFDYTKFKTAVKNNEVTALLIKPSNMYTINPGDGSDTIVANTISGNHIMMAYGYYEVKYTLKSGGTRTDKYLKVSSGLSEATLAYYKVGSYIDYAYHVKIS